MDLEGVVGKWKHGPYLDGRNRSTTWVKVLNSNYSQRTGRDDLFKKRVAAASAGLTSTMLHLEDVLQRLYDSEINVTITMLWDGGFDFAFISYMEFSEAGTPLDDLQSFVNPKPPRLTVSPWHSCTNAGELAEAIHKSALEKYPSSEYARLYGRPS